MITQRFWKGYMSDTPLLLIDPVGVYEPMPALLCFKHQLAESSNPEYVTELAALA